jgi:hypothetical protein
MSPDIGHEGDDIPGPEDVLKDLGALLKAVWAALELGAQEAREYFETHGGPIDPYLASHLARWNAKRYLEESGAEVASCEIEPDTLPYSGLRFIYAEKYHIWIRKAHKGLLPVPGPSKTLQGFYSQLSFSFIPASSSNGQLVNVMVLWDVDTNYVLDDELILACPKAGDLTRASVEAHWYTSVPHPAFTVEPSHTEIPDDLPIQLLEEGPPPPDGDEDHDESNPDVDGDAPGS